MGYRSDVRLVTTEKNWKKLSDTMRKHAKECVVGKEMEEYVAACFKPDLFKRGKGLVYAGWNNIKWYDSTDSSFMTFMKCMRGLDKFSYLRIGEDEEDIERIEKDKGYEFPYLFVLRTPDDVWVLEELDNNEEE